MKILHVSASIDGLLKYSDKRLGEIFSMNGAEIREELKKRKKQGDNFIPSENCKNFDPKTGCECGKETGGGQ